MNFKIGDIVQLGKGKIEWTVLERTLSTVKIKSPKGAVRYALSSDLTLIDASVPQMTEALGELGLLTEAEKSDGQVRVIEQAEILEVSIPASTNPQKSAYGQAILQALRIKLSRNGLKK